MAAREMYVNTEVTMTSARVLLIDPSELPISPWKNGAGTTLSIATGPSIDGTPLWRFSIATLASETARFSSFDGLDRVFTVIGDAGVRLTFGSDTREVRPWKPVRFGGAQGPICTPHAATSAFNVMVDNERASVSVTVHDLTNGPVSTDASSITLTLVRSGTASAGSIDAAEGQCLLTRGCAVRLTGSAVILIARVEPKTTE